MAELADATALGAVGIYPVGVRLSLPATSQEIASFHYSPRLARRLICIGFWGQKRIGDSVGGKKFF